MSSVKLIKFDEVQSNTTTGHIIDINIIKHFFKQFTVLNPEYITKIITIVGAQGKGKSTFLNAIITILYNYQMTPFQGADNIQRMYERIENMNSKHFDGKTQGMEGCLCTDPLQKTNWLFIDVQGLAGLSSVLDPMIVLYCYSISDLIIINSPGGLDVQSLFMFQLITRYAEYFLKASQNNKPYGIFRVLDLDGGSNSIVQSKYLSMLEKRNDSYQLTRDYMNQLFNWFDETCVWSSHPGSAIDKIKRDGNIVDFISTTPNYRNSCKKIIEIISKLPCRKYDVEKELIRIAIQVNEDFSVNNVEHFEIKDEKMKEWFKHFQKNGKYVELTEPIICENLSTTTYVAFKDRESKINDCREEFKKIFQDCNDYEKGLDDINKQINGNFLNAQRAIECHIDQIMNRIKTNLRAQLMNVFITDTNVICIDKNKFDIIVEESIGNNIAYDIKIRILNSFNEQYQNITDKFLLYREKFVNHIKNVLDQCRIEILNDKKECNNKINEYCERFELTFDEIIDICLNNVQSRYNIIIDPELTNRINKYYNDKDLKDIKTHRINTEMKNGYITVNATCFKLIVNEHGKLDITTSDLISTQDIDLSIHGNNISSLFNELRNNYIACKAKFDALRKKLMVKYLAEINQKTFDERLELFEKIKHNDLYMFNFNPDVQTDAYKMFRSDDGNNLIYTNDQFQQRFPNKVRAMYKAYRISTNEYERSFAKNEIWKFWAVDAIEKKYR